MIFKKSEPQRSISDLYDEIESGQGYIAFHGNMYTKLEVLAKIINTDADRLLKYIAEISEDHTFDEYCIQQEKIVELETSIQRIRKQHTEEIQKYQDALKRANDNYTALLNLYNRIKD